MNLLQREEGIPKVHYQTDQDELMRACGYEMNRLLLEPGARMVKSAASEAFSRDEILKHRPDDRHFLQHVIAMGDGETYSENKNGDYWPKSANEKYHPTFVSHGHLFREHRNRGKEQAIGIVKASAYNEDMRRIELLVWGDMEKAAEEYALAKAGKELSYSMSARLPYDECSICGQKSKKVSDYCGHLKTRMRQYVPEFKKYAYAINARPTFFDISRVRKPADRIAHYIEYQFPDKKDALLKAASEDSLIISGSEWAEFEGVRLPDGEPMWTPTGAMGSTIEKLAACEQELIHNIKNRDTAVTALAGAFHETLEDSPGFQAIRDLRPGSLFRQMAKKAVFLPFEAFTAYITGRTIADCAADPIVKHASMHMLPEIFSKLMGGGCSCGKELPAFCSADHSLMGDYDSAASRDEVQQFMDEVDKKFSCKMEPLHRRSVQIIIIKSAAENQWSVMRREPATVTREIEESAKFLADAYAMYKAAAISDMVVFHDADSMQLITRMSVLQNQTSHV